MTESAADPLFVEYLRQGPAADFERFCAAHPEHARRLGELRAAYELVLAHLRAAGVTAVPTDAHASASALAAASPASGELLARIVAQGSKGARYRLRGEIARGGMGVVLRVWDEDFGRELAMKVVLGDEGEAPSTTLADLGERRVARFLEEAQITGQLDHPCVVPVHELGLDAQGRVYFTMRLVQGRELGRILELVQSGAEGWTQARALDVLLRVCEAMAYAHSKGVVHRDLKPANVMVGSFGEVYVMDWGLARIVGRADVHDLHLREATGGSAVRTALRSESAGPSDSSLMTMEGDVIGTPAYMPPEQARGRIEEISTRSDVYAIGAMLYQLLSGRIPYVEPGVTQSNSEVLDALVAGPPTPLAELRRDVPPELEAICAKAMARESAERYADTLELRDDLRAFLEGRVVQAYRTGALIELKKWIERNRALAAAAAAALVFLIAGLVGSLWQKSVADENAALAASNAALAVDRALDATREGDRARENASLAERRALEAAAAAQRAVAVRDFLGGMLSSANPLNTERRDVPVSELVDAARRRLDEGEFAADAEMEFELRMTLGATYQGVGRFAESEQQYRAAAELLARMPDAAPAVALRVDVELADALASRGSYVEAEARLRSALARITAAHLDGAHLHVRALQVLASCRYNLGATGEAIELMREVVERRAKLDDPNGVGVASQRLTLAFYLGQQGKVDEGLREATSALEVLRDGPAGSRYEYSTALRRRSELEQKKRLWKAAEADLRESLAIREEMFGPESTYVADIAIDLSVCASSLGRLDEAEAQSRRALEIRKKLLGEHRDTATSLASLGSVLSERGRRAEARELLEEALAMRRKVLAPDNAGIGDCLRRLGGIARDEGDLATAETLLRDALANWTKSLGPEHPDLALALIDLERVLRALGRGDEARPLTERAVELRTKAYGDNASATTEARDELATLLLELHEWKAAEDFLREVLPRFEAVLPAGHPMIAYAGAQLGAALVGQGRLDEAEPLLLAGWKAIGENPKYWAVNKLLILDHLIALYTARGDEASVATYRAKADALRK